MTKEDYFKLRHFRSESAIQYGERWSSSTYIIFSFNCFIFFFSGCISWIQEIKEVLHEILSLLFLSFWLIKKMTLFLLFSQNTKNKPLSYISNFFSFKLLYYCKLAAFHTSFYVSCERNFESIKIEYKIILKRDRSERIEDKTYDSEIGSRYLNYDFKNTYNDRRAQGKPFASKLTYWF